MKTFDPTDTATGIFHSYMLSVVAPRPIAFVSSIDKGGKVNLSPFSFFNAFGSNPATLVFSPARRVRDNTTKHTLENVQEHAEVVINIVNYNMVEQMSLASTEYDKGVNEFIKAGFTEAPSVKVKPPRVAEAPAAFECKVQQIISMGARGGAANLVICEVILAHFQDDIFDGESISPQRLDAVARMGGDWYCRAQGDALFQLEKPVRKRGIGVDSIPAPIRNSSILTGNDLGKLGNVEALPTLEEVAAFRQTNEVVVLEALKLQQQAWQEALHHIAKKYLASGDSHTAWKALLLQ